MKKRLKKSPRIQLVCFGKKIVSQREFFVRSLYFEFLKSLRICYIVTKLTTSRTAWIEPNDHLS